MIFKDKCENIAESLCSGEGWMPDLDAPETFAARDPKGMLAHIAGLPQQCAEAWFESAQIQLPAAYRQVRSIVILGLGGSAIGGDLLRSLVSAECPVPILVHRDYDLPGFVDDHTLVLACSYSGNTEETLSGFDRAVSLGAPLVAVTTGGELGRRATVQGLPLYSYQFVSQPRAALGYSLLSLLRIVHHLGFLPDPSAAVREAVAEMHAWQEQVQPQVPASANAAKALAARLHQRLPVIYAAEHLSEVARRWKGQFNENAKSWAVFDVAPELTHNTVAGYSHPDHPRPLLHHVVLTAASQHERIRLRLDLACDLLGDAGFSWEKIEARGQSKLAQALSLLHFGDWVSYYLGMLYGVDPWEIQNIDEMKRRLGAVRPPGRREP